MSGALAIEGERTSGACWVAGPAGGPGGWSAVLSCLLAPTPTPPMQGKTFARRMVSAALAACARDPAHKPRPFRPAVTACVALANIVKSSLGPVGLDKMLVSAVCRW